MKRLVIDIETVGVPWEDHDPYVREYLIKGLNDAEAEEEKRRGALSPFIGRIVTIGVLNVDDGRAAAFIEMPGKKDLQMWREEDRTYVTGNERQILQKFWEFFGANDRFITFNGRQFDGPFIMIRSAVQGIAPKRDLVGRRYSFHPNCDLREALNFMGTVYSRQMRFNLDLACKTFGVESSKTEGMDGRSVELMYNAGQYREIGDYCLEDVRATGELYLKLENTLLRWNYDFERSDAVNPRPVSSGTDVPQSLPGEDSFIRGVEQTSADLAETIDQESEPARVDVERAQQAKVLGKFANADTEDDLTAPDEE